MIRIRFVTKSWIIFKEKDQEKRKVFEGGRERGEDKPGGTDDDFGLIGGGADLNSRVSILSELDGEEVVQLGVEDTVGNKLHTVTKDKSQRRTEDRQREEEGSEKKVLGMGIKKKGKKGP